MNTEIINENDIVITGYMYNDKYHDNILKINTQDFSINSQLYLYIDINRIKKVVPIIISKEIKNLDELTIRLNDYININYKDLSSKKEEKEMELNRNRKKIIKQFTNTINNSDKLVEYLTDDFVIFPKTEFNELTNDFNEILEENINLKKAIKKFIKNISDD